MSKRKVIGREQIADAIYSKLGKAVKKAEIVSAISLICEEIITTLENKDSVTVKNFGTLNPQIMHGQNSLNVNTMTIDYRAPYWGVRFYPSTTFLDLLEEKKNQKKKPLDQKSKLP